MTALHTPTLKRHRTGLVAVDHARSAGGYTLFAPQTADGNVYLINLRGEQVHHWKLPQRPGRDAVILANGNLGYNGQAGQGNQGKNNLAITWSYLTTTWRNME